MWIYSQTLSALKFDFSSFLSPVSFHQQPTEFCFSLKRKASRIQKIFVWNHVSLCVNVGRVDGRLKTLLNALPKTSSNSFPGFAKSETFLHHCLQWICRGRMLKHEGQNSGNQGLCAALTFDLSNKLKRQRCHHPATAEAFILKSRNQSGCGMVKPPGSRRPAPGPTGPPWDHEISPCRPAVSSHAISSSCVV